MHAYIDTYKHIQNIDFFEFFSLLTLCLAIVRLPRMIWTPAFQWSESMRRPTGTKSWRDIAQLWMLGIGQAQLDGNGWFYGVPKIIGILIWLVVWNMNFIFHSIWECHHPNWRTHSIIFQRGRSTTNQQSLSRKSSRTLHFFVVKKPILH